jgi:hypothetical protein
VARDEPFDFAIHPARRKSTSFEQAAEQAGVEVRDRKDSGNAEVAGCF